MLSKHGNCTRLLKIEKEKLKIGCYPFASSRGVLPCISHIGICRRRFGLQKGIDSAHFDLESGMVFESIKLRECMKVFIVSIPNE